MCIINYINQLVIKVIVDKNIFYRPWFPIVQWKTCISDGVKKSYIADVGVNITSIFFLVFYTIDRIVKQQQSCCIPRCVTAFFYIRFCELEWAGGVMNTGLELLIIEPIPYSSSVPSIHFRENIFRKGIKQPLFSPAMGQLVELASVCHYNHKKINNL